MIISIGREGNFSCAQAPDAALVIASAMPSIRMFCLTCMISSF
jgi:hypothetical protein